MIKILNLLFLILLPALCSAQMWTMQPDGSVVAGQEPSDNIQLQPRQENTVTVTINSTDASMNAWFAVGDQEKHFTMFRTPSRKISIQLKPGTYSIGGVYIGGKPTINVAVHEDVEIIADTVLDVKKAMATILVKFEGLNAAGKMPVLPFRSYKPDSTSLEGADVRSINIMNMLNYKGVSLGSLTGIETERKNGVDGTRSYDIKINKVSKRFEFAQYRAYETLDDDLYLTFISGKGADGDTTYYNNPAHYKPLKVNFSSLPTDHPDSLRDYKWGLYAKRLIDGKLENTAGVRAFSTKENPSMLVCVPYNGIPADSAFMAAQIFRPSLSYLKGKLHKYFGTLTQPLYYKDGEWHTLDAGICAIYGSDFSRFYQTQQILNSGQTMYLSWNSPSNMTCSFNLSKPYQPMLKGVPSVAMNPYKKGKKWTFYPMYVGRTGELRVMDATTAAYEVKNQSDGSVVATGNGKLEKESFDNPVIISYTNTNVAERNGIKGINKVEFTFDATKEDPYAPSLQMLYLADSNGCPTDSLADVNNRIIFCAGDFNYDTAKQIYTDEEAAEIKVEYAPNGSTDFKTLSYQPIENNLASHMQGRQYVINMQQLMSKSNNGWFDLKFFLKDVAGNTHTQLISPAFYVNSLKNAVDGVADDNVEIVGGVGEIIAPAHAEVFTLTGLRCGTKNLQPGIYVVKCGIKTVKTVVR